MRTLIYALVMAIVAVGLLLFDDIGVGLPVLNIAVWSVVAMTGLFLFARLHSRTRRRVRSRGSSARRPRLRQAGLGQKLTAITHR